MNAAAPAGGLVAVTGATGFLGQHLVRALAEDGWRVRILSRRDPISPFWRGLTPQVVIGDLADSAALARLCGGADLVVHAAGLISGAASDLQRVNVDGARALAQAALLAGATRFLQVSSLAAREPQLSPYAASKRASEAAAQAILGERVTVLRPCAIYGPGDRETLPFFRLAAASPILPALTDESRIALIHVQDAARQIVSFGKNAGSGVFSLCDARSEGYGWREIMQTAAEALGRTRRIIRIPAAALYVSATIDTFANGWRRRKPMLTFGKVKEVTHLNWGIRPDERASSAPAPEFDLLSGFGQTIGWYRSQGWLRA